MNMDIKDAKLCAQDGCNQIYHRSHEYCPVCLGEQFIWLNQLLTNNAIPYSSIDNGIHLLTKPFAHSFLQQFLPELSK